MTSTLSMETSRYSKQAPNDTGAIKLVQVYPSIEADEKPFEQTNQVDVWRVYDYHWEKPVTGLAEEDPKALNRRLEIAHGENKYVIEGWDVEVPQLIEDIERVVGVGGLSIVLGHGMIQRRLKEEQS